MFLRFLEAECAVHPVLIVLEDLQVGRRGDDQPDRRGAGRASPSSR